MVEELMWPGPAQLPQVAGESLVYHFTGHAHMAVASATADVAPEVVRRRLRLIPLVLTAEEAQAITSVSGERIGTTRLRDR
jgi:hypothetical protein